LAGAAAGLPDASAEPVPFSEQDLLYLAAVAEAGSEHPLARAVLEKARQAFPVIPQPEAFEMFAGKGVRALFDGQPVLVGTRELLAEQGISIDGQAEETLALLKGAGKTAVLVAYEGEALGVLGISDAIRPLAPEMIQRIRSTGVNKLVMLTGDDRLTAQAIASEAGLTDVRAELLPEDKLEAIRSLQREGHVVAMVGDGINDAPALAAANIGIAMGAAGADIAIETADIALMADDLMKIPEAIRLSKATLRNIYQNVLIALATVTVLILGVLAGQVHMAGGMLIHEASVLVVIVNGMRLLRK
jgi:Cd2+/Zn2+-exporting ATPase